MARHYLRIAALTLLVTWAIWEIASEAPLVPLLLGLVGAWVLAIDFFVGLPREVRELKARQADWAREPRKWPRVPWGLDPISAPVGVAIGLATMWWAGIAAWVLITGLLWIGWIQTRPLAKSEDRFSRGTRRVLDVGLFALVMGSVAVIVIEAASKWCEPGVLTACLGLGAWLLLTEQLARRQEERGRLA